MLLSVGVGSLSVELARNWNGNEILTLFHWSPL